MNLIQHVCRILDFPESCAQIAVNEAIAKEKLQNTYMKVNGKVIYVGKFDFATNEITTENKIKVFVEDLDVFLPEPGLYSDGVTCILLKKSPKKQWQKSFNFTVYSWNYIAVAPFLVTGNEPTFISTAKKVKFFRDSAGYVFSNKEKVALEKDGICTVTNHLFYQEILDWVTQENLPWKLQYINYIATNQSLNTLD